MIVNGAPIVPVKGGWCLDTAAQGERHDLPVRRSGEEREDLDNGEFRSDQSRFRKTLRWM